MLSVVIITYNEEKNIGRCLDSVKDVADEILVVDSFSKDDTEKICRERGAVFVQHPFQGHKEQKQYALEMASHPMVLSLDADEALSEQLRESILYAKEHWEGDAYTMNRLAYYCGKWIRHGGWYPDVKLRLFLKDKCHWGGINPHDELYLVDNGTKKHLKGDLLHYTYYAVSEHVQQANKFSEISAMSYYEMGKRSSFFKMIFNPFLKFIKDYFLMRGFLDGFYGFLIVKISSHATFLKYAKLYQLQKYNKPGK